MAHVDVEHKNVYSKEFILHIYMTYVYRVMHSARTLAIFLLCASC